MTTTIAPNVDTLQDLDFEPACQSDYCTTGHPAATHSAIFLLCTCPPLPICTHCAQKVRQNIAMYTEPLRWKCWIDGIVRKAPLAKVLRVEPLP